MTMTIQADDLGKTVSTRLSFVRHAHSNSNVAQQIRGENTCTGLTELGHQQADCLARRIELDHYDDPITQIYSPLLARAMQTAEPVAQILGLEIRHIPSWRYANYGAAEGRSWREVFDEFCGAHPALHPDRPIAEGAEPMTAFHASIRTAIVSSSDGTPANTSSRSGPRKTSWPSTRSCWGYRLTPGADRSWRSTTPPS
ncbi:histidine phosphatase family protein [Nocardia sp. NPDC058518]|uniref:histidine phosphatase family protein n=1 Tax=Nocardia sp. NPDC058518 TaxID=3346534 RepID=UPI003656B7E7